MSNDFKVEMPGGGGYLHLQSNEECDRFNTLSQQYQQQYSLRKVNDLTNLSTLLVQHVNLYRAQQAMTGRQPAVDDDGLPTGKYEMRQLKPAEIRAFQGQITDASKEIRTIETTMGVDRKSRDAQGDESVQAWLTAMKAKAVRYGLHVSTRVKKYEEFAMELRWRIRLEQNGDAEDKHYEQCSPEEIVKWARVELEKLEKVDRDFANEEGKIAIGSTP
jgi:hypothetical protein